MCAVRTHSLPFTIASNFQTTSNVVWKPEVFAIISWDLLYFQRRSFGDGGMRWANRSVGSAHGLFLKSWGRLKACVQVSDDLSYFRGHSPRYKLKIAGNIVLFDCVSIDVASVGRILVSDKIFNIPVIAIYCSNARNVGFENPTYAKLVWGKKVASKLSNRRSRRRQSRCAKHQWWWQRQSWRSR